MGNLCCWPRTGGGDPSEVMDPAPVDASRLYEDGVAAWSRYLDKGNKPSDLAETIQKATEALDAAGRDHPQRNDILLILIFALLEQNLDQSSLERIENYFSELEGWKEMENDRKADARAIAVKLATRYHESYNQAPSDFDFDRCLSNYTRVRKYSDNLEDRTDANLKIANLHQRRGQLEAAMGVIVNAKSACPPDQPGLLSSISMAKFLLHRVIYRSTGSREELEKAITEGEAALQIDSMAVTERAKTLVGVVQCIVLISEDSAEVDSEERMRKAVHYGRLAVELDTGTQVEAGIALADALSSRRTQPTIQELDEAIDLYQKAKAASKVDPEVLASLANAICLRCEKGGAVPKNGTTVQSAVKLYEQALVASDDNRWKARIANNIACVYVDKANNTNDEADYAKARDNYLDAANYLEALETKSDLGAANDSGYYRAQAQVVTETIERLKKGVSSSGRKPTPKRQSTGRSV